MLLAERDECSGHVWGRFVCLSVFCLLFVLVLVEIVVCVFVCVCVVVVFSELNFPSATASWTFRFSVSMSEQNLVPFTCV